MGGSCGQDGRWSRGKKSRPFIDGSFTRDANATVGNSWPLRERIVVVRAWHLHPPPLVPSAWPSLGTSYSASQRAPTASIITSHSYNLAATIVEPSGPLGNRWHQSLHALHCVCIVTVLGPGVHWLTPPGSPGRPDAIAPEAEKTTLNLGTSFYALRAWFHTATLVAMHFMCGESNSSCARAEPAVQQWADPVAR